MDSFNPVNILQVIGGVAGAPGSYHRNIQQGQGTLPATQGAIEDTAGVTFFHPISYIATGGLRALGAAAYRGFKRANANTHQVNTPFSQRFEHTQATVQLQQFGLSRMTGMRGVGSEAALLYGRFQGNQ